MMNRFVLFTNLGKVIVGDVRTNTNALLLEETKDIFSFSDAPRISARGFGTDPAMGIFDMQLPSIDYESVAGVSPHGMLTAKGDLKPLSTGLILKIAKGGPEMKLIAEDDERPIDVEKFEKDSETHDYEDIWDAIFKKTTLYWRAPFMPSISYGPPSMRVNRRR